MYGNQDAVVKLLLLLPIGIELHFDLFATGAHLAHLGPEADLLEGLLGIGHDRARQVRVGPGQDAVESLDQHHFASKGGIDGPQFHADIAAADHQQVFGDILQFESLGGGHHPRIAQVEIPGHRRLGTDRNDGVVVFDELLPLVCLHAQGARVFKVAPALHHLHAAHLRQLPYPA